MTELIPLGVIDRLDSLSVFPRDSHVVSHDDTDAVVSTFKLFDDGYVDTHICMIRVFGDDYTSHKFSIYIELKSEERCLYQKTIASAEYIPDDTTVVYDDGIISRIEESFCRFIQRHFGVTRDEDLEEYLMSSG